MIIKKGGAREAQNKRSKAAVGSGAHKPKEIVVRQASAHIAIANTC